MRAEGKPGRDRQIKKHEQRMSAIPQGVLKALGGWVGQAGVSPRQREGQEKQLFELMRTLRRPAPHEVSRHPSCLTDRSHQDLSLRHEGRLEHPPAIFAALAPPQFCSVLVVPKSRTWATRRNDLRDAAQSEVPAKNTMTRRASGVLWGVALPWSVPVGAQTSWTRSRTPWRSL